MGLAVNTLSQRFIAALQPQRDRLWTAVTTSAAAQSPAVRPEMLLQTAIRETFAAAEKEPDLDPAILVDKLFVQQPLPAEGTGDAMPADVWARLVAAVQVEAARSAHSRAINPDSVLLSPDPLLAPKRAAVPDDGEGFDLSPSSRFLVAAAVAVVVGIIISVYLLTRSTLSSPATHPSPPASHPSLPLASPASAPAS